MRRVGWRDNEIIETSHDIISIPLSLQKQRNSLDVQFVVKKTSQEGWSPTAIFTEWVIVESLIAKVAFKSSILLQENIRPSNILVQEYESEMIIGDNKW